ncbi:FAD-dependent oxidoreductase [Microbacterium sp. PMB16]|uniref:FAD-dependent oxidoreductase n=1 Tax=Microbacterium sp. PMB16 TaxID=3120157 RepID=UPI003F4C2E9C
MPDHDVLIVGAGPVGLLLGCLLTQDGLRVAVCERRTDADDRTRAIGIHRPGFDALDAAGVGAEISAQALRLDGGEVRSRRRTLASLDFAPDRPVLILPQPHTHALLEERLRTLSEDALHRAHDVRAVQQEGDLVRVTVDTPEGRRDLTAGLVVVADGVRSPLREAHGFDWRSRGARATYAMVDVADPVPGRRAVLHCEPEGLVESFPLPEGRRRWVVRQGPEGVLDDPGTFQDAIEARTGIRPVLAPDVTPTVFVAAQHTATRLVRGRVVLLGDAAHEISPIGGQGMNLGWVAAVHLANALTRSPKGRPDFATYESRVLRSARKAQRRSAFYMAMGAPASAVVVRGREPLIRVLGSPPLRAAAAGLITMRGL